MSVSEIERFARDMTADAALRAEAGTEAQSAGAPLDRLVAFASTRGYSFTANDLRQSIRSAGKVLSDSDLDNVAGGGWDNLFRHPNLMLLGVLLGNRG